MLTQLLELTESTNQLNAKVYEIHKVDTYACQIENNSNLKLVEPWRVQFDYQSMFDRQGRSTLRLMNQAAMFNLKYKLSISDQNSSCKVMKKIHTNFTPPNQ